MGVMNIKGGTNAYGVTQGANYNNNPDNALSAAEKEKLGGENMGEVANKLADPNWVDPSRKTRTAGNPNMDKDAFFRLMLTQMKNQDPTNPLKSHEMAAQLANFSSLEQMQNMNTTLTEMKNGQKPAENFQALNLIGKAVAGDAGKVTRAMGDKEHDFKFNLPMEAAEATIRVTNADGETIRSYDLRGLKKGDNRIAWNGEDKNANNAPPGEYNFQIEAKGSDGKKIAVKTDFDGLITGVNYTPEGPVLMIGNQTIRLKDVKKIMDPSLMRNDQKVNEVTAQDLKKNAAVSDTEKEAKTEKTQEAVSSSPSNAPMAKSKNMDDVGLSRSMMEKIAKETRE